LLTDTIGASQAPATAAIMASAAVAAGGPLLLQTTEAGPINLTPFEAAPIGYLTLQAGSEAGMPQAVAPMPSSENGQQAQAHDMAWIAAADHVSAGWLDMPLVGAANWEGSGWVIDTVEALSENLAADKD
jgi:hypothetical protein